jgi:hypothetical protein
MSLDQNLTRLRNIGLFGGLDDGLTTLNETWSYDLAGDPAGDWALLTTTGTPPLPRFGHSAIYDPLNNRMIVFGGATQLNRVTPLATGFSYDPGLNAWTPIANAPSVRAEHAAVWTGAEMLVWGGYPGGIGLSLDAGRFEPATDTWSGPLQRPHFGRSPARSVFCCFGMPTALTWLKSSWDASCRNSPPGNTW